MKMTITKPRYASMFGGAGFHNNEAMLYPILEKAHFEQVLCKCYREISPGFMRTFGGYDDWTQTSMDAFAEYYEQMQKVTDTPIYLAAAKGKVHFSDEDMKTYADGVACNLSYLYYQKNVKHLRYYCYSNEMSCGGWGDLMHDLPRFKRYHELLYEAFARYKLPIGLLATDASEYENWSTVDWAMENMPRITEDYCVHIYERAHSIDDVDFYGFFKDKCAEIVSKAVRNDGKRVILGEFGIQKGDTGHLTFNGNVVVDVNRYYENARDSAYCALMLAEMCFAAVNAGIWALALWSYTDYPDPYSCAYSSKPGYAEKWGSVERFVSGTTDVKYNKYGLFRFEDNGDHGAREPYWCLGLLFKLYKRNTKVLHIECEDALLRSCAVMTKDGRVTLGVVNRHETAVPLTLSVESFAGRAVRVYEYDPENVPVNRFADLQPPSDVLPAGETLSFSLRPMSVTFFTTDYIEKTAHTEADGVKVENGTLSWQPTDDVNHCYYRVFLHGTQIASTVGTTLDADDPDAAHYRVVSVDTSGNA